MSQTTMFFFSPLLFLFRGWTYFFLGGDDEECFCEVRVACLLFGSRWMAEGFGAEATAVRRALEKVPLESLMQ